MDVKMEIYRKKYTCTNHRISGYSQGTYGMQTEEGSLWAEIAPRAWYIKIYSYLRERGLKRSHFDPNL
jgi:hypothetical protein